MRPQLSVGNIAKNLDMQIHSAVHGQARFWKGGGGASTSSPAVAALTAIHPPVVLWILRLACPNDTAIIAEVY